jgi:hypothetical protein
MSELQADPVVCRPFKFTFVALGDHKKQTTVEVENEYMSFAYADALTKATLELGTSVVLKQDHPHYKYKS